MTSDYEYLDLNEESCRRRVGDDTTNQEPTEEEEDNEETHHDRNDERIESKWVRRWAVGLYALTTMLLFADQNLMAPNLSAIAQEFGFDDEQRDKKLGGDIALAFFVLGAPASFLVGCWADQVSNRMALFGWTVGIGEGACVATCLVRTYRQLYITRAITGVSLGGALPLIFSVLGDWFAAKDRHVVNAIVGIGTGVGIGFGQGVAGFLGPTFGWRLPFAVVGIPAIICAALVVWTVPEPTRGAMERAYLAKKEERQERGTELDHPVKYNKTEETLTPDDTQQDGLVVDHDPPNVTWWNGQDWNKHFRTFVSLLSIRTVILLLLQGAPGCVPWGIINTYLNDFLSKDRGMTVEGATVTVLCFGIGNFIGLIGGGAGARYLYQMDPRYPSILSGSMAILGCFPFWVLLNSVDASTPLLQTGTITLLAGIGSGATGPIVKATLQNVTMPTARGQAFALFNTFDDFGRGLGPVFVALLIVHLGGRTQAFNVGVFGWVLCGLFNLATFMTVQQDETRVQAILSASLDDVVTEEETRMVV